MSATTVKLTTSNWGKVKNPRTGQVEQVKKFTWSNQNHVQVEIITYGVIITNLYVPNRNGKLQDIVLGFDSIDGYLRKDNPYFGAAVGRVANRIGGAKFTLNGAEHQVAKNHSSKHHLHGGFVGFDKYNWNHHVTGTKVVFTLMSLDGDEGYPGDLITTVTAGLDDENRFELKFNAWCTKPTPVNLTNHSYFNLAGHDAGYKELYNHFICINADKITETDIDSIPSGRFLSVTNTPFDLRIPKKLGPALAAMDAAIGFDDNFCVTQGSECGLSFVGRVSHESGRTMEVYSDQPGVQFYTANYIADPEDKIHPPDGKKITSPNRSERIPGKDGAEYTKHSGLCLETQKFPNAVNIPSFPSTILNPGETYQHTVVYKFFVGA